MQIGREIDTILFGKLCKYHYRPHTMRIWESQVKSLVPDMAKSDLCSWEIIEQDGIRAVIGG